MAGLVVGLTHDIVWKESANVRISEQQQHDIVMSTSKRDAGGNMLENTRNLSIAWQDTSSQVRLNINKITYLFGY